VGSLIAATTVPAAKAAQRAVVARLSSKVPASLFKQAEAKATQTLSKANATGFSWAESSAKTASMAAGLYVAHRTRQLTLLCSGALLGSKMVVGAVGTQVKALLDKTDVDEAIVGATSEWTSRLKRSIDRLDGVEDGAIAGVKFPLDATATAEIVLAGFGIALQLGVLGGGLPMLGVLKAPLAPLFAFEAYLKASAVATAARAAAMKNP